MFRAIGEFWTKYAMWDKLYWIYAILLLICAIVFIWKNFKHNPVKDINFIVEANKNNCITLGKLSCFTLHGYGHPSEYHLEYMYYVNDKRYFVTYEMNYMMPIDSRTDAMNADMLLMRIPPVLILFHDKKNPKKVISKYEVFTSRLGLRQIKTSKKNVWRDINRDWIEPINLVNA